MLADASGNQRSRPGEHVQGRHLRVAGAGQRKWKTGGGGEGSILFTWSVLIVHACECEYNMNVRRVASLNVKVDANVNVL